MKLRILLLGVMACVCVWAADAPKGGGKVDGVWKPLKGELGGRPMPEEVMKSITLTLTNSNYDVYVGTDTARDRGTAKYNTKVAPMTIDITGTNGPNMGKTIPAIYEVDGDTLRVCYDLSGAKHPTEFKTTPGTQLFLVTYQRKKD